MKPYYETENGKLYQCDNVEYLKSIDNDSFDMTVTSPPYDNLRDYKGYSWNFEELAKELYRTTKQGGVVVWVVGDATINGSETGSSFRQALYFMECGFNLHDTMIWEKRVPPCNNKRYEPAFEYMFILVKGKIEKFNGIKTKRLIKDKRTEKQFQRTKDKKTYKQYANKSDSVLKTNIWIINNRDVSDHDHPAIFPEKLAHDHIISWSNENDIVFDPFMGSGTIAKMAERSKRRWIGCEISKEYCDITKHRIENEIQQLKLNF